MSNSAGVWRGMRLRRIGVVRTISELVLVGAIVLIAATRPSPAVMWRGKVVYRVATREKVVALTFDDGPYPVYTQQILDILDQCHVKATFFMIGKNMETHPEIVRDVVKRGHVIGNHTYDHPKNLELGTQAQVVRELDSCEQVIERLTGSRAHLFRPPRGLIDGGVLMIADAEGYCTVLWSVCVDHRAAATPELMAQRVLERNVRGAIVLVHDGGCFTRWKDVAVTPILIERFRKRGYRFVTVPELLKMR